VVCQVLVRNQDNDQKQLQYSGRFVASALRLCSGQSGSAFGTAFLGTAEQPFP